MIANVDYGFVDEQEQFATGIFEDDHMMIMVLKNNLQ